MIAYFDTSAFVKLVVSEAGSAEVGRIWDLASRTASSILLYPGPPWPRPGATAV